MTPILHVTAIFIVLAVATVVVGVIRENGLEFTWRCLCQSVRRWFSREEESQNVDPWWFEARLLVNELAELRQGKDVANTNHTVAYILACMNLPGFDVADHFIRDSRGTRADMAAWFRQQAAKQPDEDKKQFLSNLGAMMLPEKWDAA